MFRVSTGHFQVIWRWWKISPRIIDRFSKPGEQIECHKDFLDDQWLQSEVSVVFGPQILEYAIALCEGQYDYLDRLSDALVLRILNYLELEDVGQLGRTSCKFRRICGSEEFWEQTVRRCCSTVSAEVASLALEVGWRRIFFTNKVELQKLISRRRMRAEEDEKDDDDDEEEFPIDSSETDQLQSDAGSHHDSIARSSFGTVTSVDTNDTDPVPNPEHEAGSDSNINRQ
ncbi:hypothetical protein LDENG_00124290 [Lucifuga dentata]|nr:hypothetical protein LDENG_00124290 [Lucifuga dentata]